MKGSLLKEYSKRSFYKFFKIGWQYVESSEFSDNWHIEEVCNLMELRFMRQYYRQHQEHLLHDVLINMPPGSTKSLIVSVFFPAWAWLWKPTTKFITASYSHKIAEELSGKFLRLVQSDFYRTVNTGVRVTSSAVGNVKNNKGGQRFVTSTTGTVTGMHADVIICDDVNSPQSMFSEADREQAKKFINEILPSRKTSLKNSYTVYVQQRLHTEDAAGILLDSGREFFELVVPAINDDGESFFPSRFSLEDLQQIKEQLGLNSFNAQYMQTPVIAGGGIIKRKWLIEEEVKPGELIYFIDSAYGGQLADYNAILGVYKKHNNLYIVTCETNKYEFPELLDWLKENLPDNARVYIEGKASGKSIIQTLKRETTFNVTELKVRSSKIERKHAVSPFFESGRIIINRYIKNKADLIEQLILDQTRHDDILDTVMHAIETLLVRTSGRVAISIV